MTKSGVETGGPEAQTDGAGTDPASGEPIAAVGGWDRNDANLLNRELSWLAFNARVLELARNPDVPLLERARFLAIYESNLDEFFQVRVSRLQHRVAAQITARTPDGRTPTGELREIREVVIGLGDDHQGIFDDVVRPELAAAGIELVDFDDLTAKEQHELGEHFVERIFPVLTPLAVDPGHPFPYISDLSLNLAVLVQDRSEGRRRFARIKVPNTLPRWVRVGDDPADNGGAAKPPGSRQHRHKHKHRPERPEQPERFVLSEQVIAAHLHQLFPGMEIVEHHTFRVTRNFDLAIEEEEADDLLAAVEYELRRRRFGRATRLEISSSMSEEVLDLLVRELDLEPRDVYASRAPLDARSLNEIAGLDRPDLHWRRRYGVTEPELQVDGDDPVDFFRVLRRSDVLVHHPYSSFKNSVIEFIQRAAADPKVLAIKLTLYRTSGDSPIIDALIAAAERGKQVAVLVEVKARFDEAANIGWARRLERAGVHVVHGLVGLKIHTKIAMVVREEASGIRRYCHIGTGNYNHRTARLYEDFGLLTASPKVGEDLANLFNFLTGYGREIHYDRLLVAPDGLRKGLVKLIKREMRAEQGRIVLKMNALVDHAMIDKLYAASQAGVQIDLLVRGICSLRPQLPGLSENIRVRSIVGRYLEHSRMFWFANGDGPGCPRVLIGSADLMPRNLNRRVEALVRVDEARLKQRLREVIDIELADDRLAWTLDGDGVWSLQRGPEGIDSHVQLHKLASARSGA